jgi:hypothetical protein
MVDMGSSLAMPMTSAWTGADVVLMGHLLGRFASGVPAW